MNRPTKVLDLDAAATTPVAPEVLAQMVDVLSGEAGDANPASVHRPGETAASLVAAARAAIAAELGSEPDEVLFTSGATEANNLALRGVALAHQAQGRHLITSAIEHKSVLACCAALQRDGYAITVVNPNRQGWVEPDAVQAALRPDTLLVALMHTNNETGVLQPIAEVAEIAAEAGVLLHVDAAQAAGKFPLDLQRLPIDLLALSAHKVHGPKGVGALIVRNRRQLRLQPLMFGGGQEFGLRPGTLATHQIVGLSTALTLAARRRDADLAQVAGLKAQLLAGLGAHLPIQIHGDPRRSSPYIVNLAIPGVSSAALINQLRAEVALASGSACSSGTVEPSSTLRAMGIQGEALYGAVRLSFHRNHTSTDIAWAVERIVAAVQRIQELSA